MVKVFQMFTKTSICSEFSQNMDATVRFINLLSKILFRKL
jgi:hypothetical protein